MSAPTPYYSADGITIYHGDCAEIAPTLGRFDLLCTDPPYGIGAGRRIGKLGNAWGRSSPEAEEKRRRRGKYEARRFQRTEADWDDAPPSQGLLDQFVGLASHQVIFGGNYFTLRPARCWLIWDKDNGATDFADAELAWTNYDCPVRLKRYLWNGVCRAVHEPRYHPTQKPLAVMSWAISLCPERPKTVLDPFMGSGTTLRACKDLGISAVGIEREEKYCEIAVRRLAQTTLALGAP